MTTKWLFKPIPITFLALWRFLFGLVLFIECLGANLVGWTRQVFIDIPLFTFSFIGFEWLQPLPGNGMYMYFYVMALLGLCIALGYRYRFSMALFTIGWAGVYFMHKASYNNHHYLMLLLCLMMCFSPAHRALSFDVKRRPDIALGKVWALFKWQFVILLLIVYSYAAIAKLYPDWMNAVLTERWLSYKTEMPLLGPIYSWSYSKYVVAWGGILFDFLIIPAMLFKRTRTFAFVLGIFFHLANSITFEIGTFPYMMIASAVFFFPDSVLRSRLKRFQPVDTVQQDAVRPQPKRAQGILMSMCVIFFLIQIVLPLRHHLFKGDVVWNEEGHRLSWRMMLRAKSGSIHFNIVLPDGSKIVHGASNDLSLDQYRTMTSSPDMIWQYCQYLKEKYGPGIQIYAISEVSLNFRPTQTFIDPEYDMAKASWRPFKHSEWVLAGPTY